MVVCSSSLIPQISGDKKPGAGVAGARSGDGVGDFVKKHLVNIVVIGKTC
jgi:hypothetical protein